MRSASVCLGNLLTAVLVQAAAPKDPDLPSRGKCFLVKKALAEVVHAIVHQCGALGCTEPAEPQEPLFSFCGDAHYAPSLHGP